MRYKIKVGGLIGVPLSYLHISNGEQFDLINCLKRYEVVEDGHGNPRGTHGTDVDGKSHFARCIIRRKV